MLQFTPSRVVTLSVAVLALSLVSTAGKQVHARCHCSAPILENCDGYCESTLPQRCGMAAPDYPVPYWVPTRVGWTELTYPPMMPHHSLPHYRKAYAYRHGLGLSRTTVRWYKPHVVNAFKYLHHIIELPR